MIGNILILVALILLNGVLTSSEIALISVNKNRVKILAEDGNKRAELLLKVIDEPSRFLSTLQIGISFIVLFSGAFAVDTFYEPIVNFFNTKGTDVSHDFFKPFLFLVITMILCYFTILFGQLIPKNIGIKKSTEYSLLIIKPVNFISKITYPIVKVLSISTEGFLKIFGISTNIENGDITEEEIRMLVDAGSEVGTIDNREQEMINNIFELDDKTVEDVSVHRTDITAISISADNIEIMQFLADEKYSRIPVYEENLDNIIGILHIKDILKYMINNGSLNDLNIRTLIRDPYFVPFSKKADELFMEMQKTQVHMAIVVDEYGGTLGLVTMEDIVEEIMGSILDEHDEIETPDINKIEENTYRINGTTDLEIVNDCFEDVNLPIEDYDTLSGFLIGQIGRIPNEGEKPEVEYNGLLFKVNETEDKRISSVIVCRI